MLNLNVLGFIPTLSSSSTLSCPWVVLAGCPINDLLSPKLAISVNSLRESTNSAVCCLFAFKSIVNTPPNPFCKYF